MTARITEHVVKLAGSVYVKVKADKLYNPLIEDITAIHTSQPFMHKRVELLEKANSEQRIDKKCDQ